MFKVYENVLQPSKSLKRSNIEFCSRESYSETIKSVILSGLHNKIIIHYTILAAITSGLLKAVEISGDYNLGSFIENSPKFNTLLTLNSL